MVKAKTKKQSYDDPPCGARGIIFSEMGETILGA
jgi:hypothetical protein